MYFAAYTVFECLCNQFVLSSEKMAFHVTIGVCDMSCFCEKDKTTVWITKIEPIENFFQKKFSIAIQNFIFTFIVIIKDTYNDNILNSN